MIRNMQLSGWSQDIQYTHVLLMEPYIALMDNIMPKMMGKISQMLKV